MARQEIDLTTPQPNGKMGEPTKSAWEKVNDMTEELYIGVESAVKNTGGAISGNLSVSGRGTFGSLSTLQIRTDGSAGLHNSQGVSMGWNGDISGGAQFINNRGLGLGGWVFRTVNSANTENVGAFQFGLYGEFSSNATQRFSSSTDNSHDLGSASLRWKSIFASNGVIQTSDENHKDSIKDETLGVDFILGLRPVTFLMKESGKKIIDGYEVSVPGERRHHGFIAQDVRDSLSFNGVPPEDSGIWILSDKSDDSSMQGLRYDELIAPLVKAVQELALEVKRLQEN